jgi:hypothetical protein
MICFVFDFILHYVFVLHECVVARIRPSQSLIYDIYAGDKSDAGVGSGRLGRLLCSYRFRFSVLTWNLFEIAV